MKILVVGGSSFIGYRIYTHMKENGFNVIGTYYKHKKNEEFVFLDITDKNSILLVVKEHKPDIVLWVAGSKNLKFCEEDIENAKRLNTYPIVDYIQISKDLGLGEHFIYFSTDYIFDGKKGSYSDKDIPNPSTNYGKSNYISEQNIISSSLDFTIIRTTAVMGANGTFFSWLVSSLKKDESIEMLDDIYFTPTPIKLLIDSILQTIKERKIGIYNICGNEKYSRFEFAKELKKLDESFRAKLVPKSTDESFPYMHHDLSMIQSDFCKNIKQKSFREYYVKEIDV